MPDEGREIVNRLVAQRVHLLKIHNGLSRETFLAIAEEAKRWRLPFDGHLPAGMTIVEASEAGQRTVEHVGALGPVCASNPAALQQGRGAPPPTEPIEIDRPRCEEALRRLVRNGTWLTPTIGAPGQGIPRTRAFNLALVRMAFAAGVRLLPGTDWPGGGYWRGQYATASRTPWDDLAGMVEAGLTPADALRVGIVNPARLLGIQHQLGRVEAGYLADLVLLDADPLLDIANATRISAVVANGRLVDAAQRQRILDSELAAQKGTAQR
ncbi:MAG: amidohydrolase family protein [Acidobacteria bacterium]|nr:amidohydrolase family protein [Acidobacteriota bacterium]